VHGDGQLDATQPRGPGHRRLWRDEPTEVRTPGGRRRRCSRSQDTVEPGVPSSLPHFAMPVAAPSPRLMRDVGMRFATKSARRSRVRGLCGRVSLTSMIDCLVVIVAYLLNLFQGSGECGCPPIVKLPRAAISRNSTTFSRPSRRSFDRLRALRGTLAQTQAPRCRPQDDGLAVSSTDTSARSPVRLPQADRKSKATATRHPRSRRFSTSVRASHLRNKRADGHRSTASFTPPLFIVTSVPAGRAKREEASRHPDYATGGQGSLPSHPTDTSYSEDRTRRITRPSTRSSAGSSTPGRWSSGFT
jgi:hypothetical protein